MKCSETEYPANIITLLTLCKSRSCDIVLVLVLVGEGINVVLIEASKYKKQNDCDQKDTADSLTVSKLNV